MNIESIRQIHKELIKSKSSFYSFELTTNAKSRAKEMSEALFDIMDLAEDLACRDEAGSTPISIRISRDRYHEDPPEKNLRYLFKLPGTYFGTDYQKLIHMGRATKGVPVPTYEKTTSKYFKLEAYMTGNTLAVSFDSELYVNIDGEVLNNCNLSYKAQKKEKSLGNVNDQGLAKLLLDYANGFARHIRLENTSI